MSCVDMTYWLSRIQVMLPKQKRLFRYQMHKLIWEAFPRLPKETKQPFLFAIQDQVQQNAIPCLIQSKLKPDWSAMGEQKSKNVIRLGYVECKKINLHIYRGDQFIYQLNTCPMKNIYKGKSRRGIKVPLYNTLGVEKWLERQAQLNGFHPLQHEYFSEKILVRRKPEVNAKDIMLAVCKYTAHIQVDNPHKFSESLIKGIGSKKIFGFGMPLLSSVI